MGDGFDAYIEVGGARNFYVSQPRLPKTIPEEKSNLKSRTSRLAIDSIAPNEPRARTILIGRIGLAWGEIDAYLYVFWISDALLI